MINKSKINLGTIFKLEFYGKKKKKKIERYLSVIGLLKYK